MLVVRIYTVSEAHCHPRPPPIDLDYLLRAAYPYPSTETAGRLLMANLPVFDTFTTSRLRAERLTADHLPEIRRMHGDPVVMAHLGGVRDDVETEAYLARNLQHWTEYGFGLWILRERAGGEPIGRAVLRHLLVDAVDEVEVGYAFYPPFWGRGLATEVTLACLALGRHELGRTSFVAVTRPSNLASQRVLVKAGLVYDREVMHGGEPHCLFRTT